MVVTTPELTQLEERRQPTTTLSGWRRFVQAEEARFTLLPHDRWQALDTAERTRSVTPPSSNRRSPGPACT